MPIILDLQFVPDNELLYLASLVTLERKQFSLADIRTKKVIGAAISVIFKVFRCPCKVYVVFDGTTEKINQAYLFQNSKHQV